MDHVASQQKYNIEQNHNRIESIKNLDELYVNTDYSEHKEKILILFNELKNNKNFKEKLLELRTLFWIYLNKNNSLQTRAIIKYISRLLLVMNLVGIIPLSLTEKNIIIKIIDQDSQVKTIGLGPMEMVLFQLSIDPNDSKLPNTNQDMLFIKMISVMHSLSQTDPSLYQFAYRTMSVVDPIAALTNIRLIEIIIAGLYIQDPKQTITTEKPAVVDPKITQQQSQNTVIEQKTTAQDLIVMQLNEIYKYYKGKTELVAIENKIWSAMKNNTLDSEVRVLYNAIKEKL